MDTPRTDESVGSFTYERLVGLTYLCGRGLGPEELARRFLTEIRPCIPATGTWLLHRQQVVAADVESGPDRPVMPELGQPQGLVPLVDEHGGIAVPVLPEMALLCRLAHGSVQRATDVVTLAGRVIALAWRSEMIAREEDWGDDYAAAKSDFRRRYLRSLMRRHGGNISAAARSAGLSRTTLHTLVLEAGLGGVEAEAGTPGLARRRPPLRGNSRARAERTAEPAASVGDPARHPG